jgi:hypothetical protein
MSAIFRLLSRSAMRLEQSAPATAQRFNDVAAHLCFGGWWGGGGSVSRVTSRKGPLRTLRTRSLHSGER